MESCVCAAAMAGRARLIERRAWRITAWVSEGEAYVRLFAWMRNDLM
jgi:hypothetical protein